MTRVEGYCPMGCGNTLFVGDGGHITCSLIGCPVPDAVSQILEAAQETGHVVDLREDGWTLQHPLRERITGLDLFDCTVPQQIGEALSQTSEPGRYRITFRPDQLIDLERLC